MLIAFLFFMVIPVSLAGCAVWVLTARPEEVAVSSGIWQVKV